MPTELSSGFASCEALDVLPDREHVVVAGRDSIATVDLRSGVAVSAPLELDYSVKAVAGLAGGRVLVATISEVALYGPPEQGLLQERRWPMSSIGSIIGLGAASAGSRFAVAAGGRLLVGSVTDAQLAEIELDDCVAVGLSRDGATVMAGHGDAVEVFEGASLRHLRTLRTGGGVAPLIGLGVRPTGDVVIAADDITQVFRWSLGAAPGPAGEVGDALAAAAKAVSITWSPDGSCFAVVGLTRLVALYDAVGEPIAHLKPAEWSREYIVGGGWSPDGRCLVAGFEDGRLVVWRVGDARR